MTNHQQWESNAQEEIQFWREWIRTRGDRWPKEFSMRLDPAVPVHPILADVLGAVRDDPLRVLDVGSGPLTSVGKRLGRRKVLVTPVDALADKYNAILDEYGIKPPIRTIACAGEELVNLFAPRTFHVAYCRNALDHMIDPPKVLTAMWTVIKPDGWVVLEHYQNEGVFEAGRGLHQWNLEVDGDQLFIWSRETRVSVHEHFQGARRVNIEVTELDGRPWIVARFQKRHSRFWEGWRH